MPPAFVLSQDQTLQSKNLTVPKNCCFLNGKSDSFYCVTTVISASNEASLKPLTRAHRTIQHFSKNTPATRLKCPPAVSRTRLKAHTFPDDSSSVLVSGWSPTHPPDRGRRLALPQSRRRMTSLQNRTALFNIASIFCLSMLFSKNSGKFFPGPL